MVNRERGQMILVGAVLVAIAILGSVVLLNVLHVPADIDTQQDSRSLDAVERTSAQVANDLERVFLVHTSMNETGERVPYARESGGPHHPDFDTVVENYSSATADLTASGASRIVSVEHLPGAGGQTGTFLRHNSSAHNLTYPSYDAPNETEWRVLESADSMPYFHLRVDGEDESGNNITTHPFRVEMGGEWVEFRESEVVDQSGTTLLDAKNSTELYPVELELVDGRGEIRNDSDRHPLQPNLGTGFDVTFGYGNVTTGTYMISGMGVGDSGLDPSRRNDSYQYKKGPNVLVNPKFQVNITDASVTHTMNFSLYNRSRP